IERRRGTMAGTPIRRQFPWVRSSFAAAAALMIGYYIWAVYHTPELHGLSPVAAAPPHVLTDTEKLAVLYNSFELSNTDEGSDVVEHVAAVASVAPSDADDSSDAKSDSN